MSMLRRVVAPALSRVVRCSSHSAGVRCGSSAWKVPSGSCAAGRPLCGMPQPLRALCTSAGTPTESWSAGGAELTAPYAPSYSRSARRERLHAALSQAATGGAFDIPQPEPQSTPGPCGAVTNILTERGPLTTNELFDAVEAQHPGIVRSKTHLKQHILKRALANKLMKVKLNDSKVKDRWALRRPGQIRMGIAR
eukprot:CAMPEP_0115846916 /NCGR_PEP_ID=MMETSP0287-20121206/10107_1 /TAXON_ID=412157 /ORGANISM="Chrysochromulina rotalis, Strain UIO044" /LENGTH=194 /DNA_ID=CAMNT_0003300721 /DNA_START=13 /DNA_END=597 /DNA_ORIENTATION=-